MNKIIQNLISLSILSLIFSTAVLAQDRPIQLALFNPIQIYPEKDNITGVRLSLLYGKNSSVTGLDIGLVNHSTEGLSQGIQYGAVGIIESDFIGWQDNFINITKQNCTGLQLGIYNHAGNMKGIQFGIVNYAVNMEGLQIGLINIIKHGGQFPFSQLLTGHFNMILIYK